MDVAATAVLLDHANGGFRLRQQIVEKRRVDFRRRNLLPGTDAKGLYPDAR
jgi:hypothetical protein